MKEKQTKSRLNIWSIILILISIFLVISLSIFAYAKYIEQKNGQVTAKIAQWKFDVKDGTNTTGITINLAETRENDSQKVNSNYIAPRNQRFI